MTGYNKVTDTLKTLGAYRQEQGPSHALDASIDALLSNGFAHHDQWLALLSYAQQHHRKDARSIRGGATLPTHMYQLFRLADAWLPEYSWRETPHEYACFKLAKDRANWEWRLGTGQDTSAAKDDYKLTSFMKPVCAHASTYVEAAHLWALEGKLRKAQKYLFRGREAKAQPSEMLEQASQKLLGCSLSSLRNPSEEWMSDPMESTPATNGHQQACCTAGQVVNAAAAAGSSSKTTPSGIMPSSAVRIASAPRSTAASSHQQHRSIDASMTGQGPGGGVAAAPAALPGAGAHHAGSRDAGCAPAASGAASIRPAAPLPFMNEGPRASAPAAAEVTFDALRKAEYRGGPIRIIINGEGASEPQRLDVSSGCASKKRPWDLVDTFAACTLGGPGFSEGDTNAADMPACSSQHPTHTDASRTSFAGSTPFKAGARAAAAAAAVPLPLTTENVRASAAMPQASDEAAKDHAVVATPGRAAAQAPRPGWASVQSSRTSHTAHGGVKDMACSAVHLQSRGADCLVTPVFQVARAAHGTAGVTQSRVSSPALISSVRDGRASAPRTSAQAALPTPASYDTSRSSTQSMSLQTSCHRSSSSNSSTRSSNPSSRTHADTVQRAPRSTLAACSSGWPRPFVTQATAPPSASQASAKPLRMQQEPAVQLPGAEAPSSSQQLPDAPRCEPLAVTAHPAAAPPPRGARDTAAKLASHPTPKQHSQPSQQQQLQGRHAVQQQQQHGHTPQQQHQQRMQPAAQQRGEALGSSSSQGYPASKPQAVQEMTVNGKRYLLLSVMGYGASALVYKAQEPGAECVALKLVNLHNKGEQEKACFMEEITLLQTLKGRPHIIQMYDYEVTRDQLVVIMELGQQDMEQVLLPHIRKRHAQPPGSVYKVDIDTMYYWKQMLQAVREIQSHRIVHADLKLKNYLMVGSTVKLIDFGIAKPLPDEQTCLARPHGNGTPSYMSPEVAYNYIHNKDKRLISRKADIWSMGVILYRLIYGRCPFDQYQEPVSKARAIIDDAEDISFPPTNNPSAEDMLRRCLTRDVAQRISLEEIYAHPFLHASPGPAAATAAQPIGDMTMSELFVLILKLSAASGLDAEAVAQQVVSKWETRVLRSKAAVEKFVQELARSRPVAEAAAAASGSSPNVVTPPSSDAQPRPSTTPNTPDEAAQHLQRPPLQPRRPPPPPPKMPSVLPAISNGPKAAPFRPPHFSNDALVAAAANLQRPRPQPLSAAAGGRGGISGPAGLRSAGQSGGGVGSGVPVQDIAREAAARAACRGNASAAAVSQLESRASAMRQDAFSEELLQKRSSLRHAAGTRPALLGSDAVGPAAAPPMRTKAGAAHLGGKENLPLGSPKAEPEGLAAHLLVGFDRMDFGEETRTAAPASPFTEH